MNYIGIDIGDGESCVCVLPSASDIEPRPVTITGRKSFISAVADGPDGKPIIGMEAVSANIANGFSVRFKSRFLTDAQSAHADMRRFLKGIHDAMEKEGLLKGETRVTVGCPAGWKKDARSLYQDMLRSAGFPSARLVSESRAAFLYAKHARTIQMDPTLIEDSALVIDIGSSTLDFAYVVNGRETNVGTFGDVFLGGGAIDEALLQSALNASSRKKEILNVFDEAPEWRSYCLLAARRLKEDYFTRQSGGEKNIRCREMLTLMYDEPLPLLIQADEQLIWRVVNLGIESLNGLSFYGMLKKALDHAYEQTKARLPKLVLLTGGASRMQFFQELCFKRFPGAHFVVCEEPEFSIAKGLAYSVRVDDGLHAFNQAIDDYLKGKSIRNAVSSRMDHLVKSVSECMADIGYDEACAHIDLWREGKYESLRDMNKGLGNAIADRMRSKTAGEAIITIIKNEMNEVCVMLQSEIDEICKRYNIASSQMQLRGVDALPGASVASKLDVQADLSYLQRSVQAAVTAIVAAVMIMIPGGFIMDIVMVAVTAAAAWLGQDFIGSFTESFNIPQKIRKMIPREKIINGKVREKLLDAFGERLQKDAGFRSDVSEEIQACLTDYVSRMAQKTEIAITSGDDE